MHVYIIANPVAGAGRGREAGEELERALAAQGCQVERHETQGPGHAAYLAAAAQGDTLAIVGGDGTANEAVNALGDKDIALAILPVGSANVVAREFDLPANPERSAAMIAANKTCLMDLGTWEGGYFLLGGGAGLDAAVTAKVKAQRGSKSSVWQWVRPSIETILRYTYPKIRVTVDGELLTDEAEYVIVGNCVYSAGVFPATPKAKTDDGLLDICALRRLGKMRLIHLAMTAWRPSFIEHPDVSYIQGRTVQLDAAADGEAACLQIDGDPAGAVPASFGISPNALRIVVPDGHPLT